MRKGLELDPVKVVETLVAQLSLTDGFALVLVDIRGMISMTRRAMHAASNSPVNDSTAAMAILAGNPVSTFIGNYFIRCSRPPYPARLFHDEVEARRWLLEEIKGGPRVVAND